MLSPRPHPGCMELDEFKKHAQLGFIVRQAKYRIANLSNAHLLGPGTFALIRDGDETTAIEEMPDDDDGEAMRMITFTPDLPSGLVGFMALVSSVMAREGVPIFVVSSLRTDHLLVIEEDLEKARAALLLAGFVQTEG